VEDFKNELRLVFRFRRFEKEDRFMEEDRETRPDEDVEGHANKLNVDQVKLANDEGDDVEGHANKLNVDQVKLANDEGDDDDVDAHMVKSQQKAQNKL
jgi:hypothetical protein